jgi:hypothetical protein
VGNPCQFTAQRGNVTIAEQNLLESLLPKSYKCEKAENVNGFAEGVLSLGEDEPVFTPTDFVRYVAKLRNVPVEYRKVEAASVQVISGHLVGKRLASSLWTTSGKGKRKEIR